MNKANRKKLEALVWRTTHRDFKGKLADDTKTVMVLANGGSALAALTELTDDQLLDKLTTVAWAEFHGYKYTKGQRFDLKAGDPVMCGKHRGTVSRIRDAESGMGEVRLERGTVVSWAEFPECYPAL